MKSENTHMRKQAGIALVTTLLLLVLMAAMVVGFMLLVAEGQRLSGMDSDQMRAFYGAESGMEKLTADLGALFGTTYSPNASQVNALTTTPPALPSSTGVSYVDAQGNNTYSISYPVDANGNPKAAFAQITSGSSAFQGMTALETTYTLTVGALTNTGAQVKLQRTTQTVGIPLFQFGIFSQTDLSFFPGPNFDFGGRVHTNGNLFLDSGGPPNATPTMTTTDQLWMRSPVTAVGDILRDCLSNGYPESTSAKHPGSVEITKGGTTMQALGFGQGSYTGCLGAGAKNTNWPTVSASFNGNLRSGVKPLNMTITLLGSTSPVDIIRRPVANEDTTNAGVLGERYFSEASLRILLSDNASDITSLPCVSSGAPFNLADLALPVASWTTANATALKTLMTTNGTIPLPLAASGAASTGYVPGTGVGGASTPGGDGYWLANGKAVITGYIKIDAQTAYGSPCGTYKDVTQEILSLGYAGRNINPVSQSFNGTTLNPMWAALNNYMQGGAAPALPGMLNIINAGYQLSGQNGPTMAAGTFTGPSTNPATGGYSTGTCLDPHPNAIIRLERIRDNPSSVNYQSNALKTTSPTNYPVTSTVAEVCGVDPAFAVTPTPTLAKLRTSPTAAPATGAAWVPQPSDFWPNVLYDTREGYNREVAPTAPFNNRVTLGGTMYYIELDMKNLAKWFKGTLPTSGSSGPSTMDQNIAPNDFVVYISDRRSNYAPSGAYAGAWPPRSPSGNETGEYGYNDLVNGANASGCPNGTLDTGEDADGTGVLYSYGETSFPNGLIDSTGVQTWTNIWSMTPVVADPLCATGTAGTFPWPRAFLLYANEARENPAALFRRAVKLVDGNVITLPTCPTGVSCGLTVATENPAYIQGDFNANSAGGGFGDASAASSVVADAVTMLSNDWNDYNSFNSPFNVNARQAPNDSWYRLGVVAGKQISFPKPAWDTTTIDGSQDFGTDGGVHNFLRFLENWNSTLHYEGSIVSMFYSRQANGLFNSGSNNYSPPTRGYSFDVNFLNPNLLPPRTPMFRDVNTTGFTQLMLPTQ